MNDKKCFILKTKKLLKLFKTLKSKRPLPRSSFKRQVPCLLATSKAACSPIFSAPTQAN
jgi:hypothetical protein